MKVKFFEGSVTISERGKRHGVKNLGEKVNEWLKNNPNIEVFNITQSSASYGLSDDFDITTVISIFYTEKGE